MMEAVSAAEARYELLQRAVRFRPNAAREPSLDEHLATRAVSVRYPCVDLWSSVHTLPLQLWVEMRATDTFLPWYFQTFPERFVRLECEEQYLDKDHIKHAFYTYYVAAHGSEAVPLMVTKALEFPPRKNPNEQIQQKLLYARVMALTKCDALIYPNLRMLKDAYLPDRECSNAQLFELMGLAVYFTLAWKTMTVPKNFVDIKELLTSERDPLRPLFVHWERHHLLNVWMHGQRSGHKLTPIYIDFVEPALAGRGASLNLKLPVSSGQLRSALDRYDPTLCDSPQWQKEVRDFFIGEFAQKRPDWTR